MPRFLVTSGNTRERIDRVRDWGNIFTGNTGLRIARALSEFGEVDLLTSNRAHITELTNTLRISASPFMDHAELRGALAALVSRMTYDAMFMSAAVADYRPAGAFEIVQREQVTDCERWTVRNVQAGKVKSSHKAIAFLGEPTEKIIDLFRTEWNYRGLLVKFKLEVGISDDELLKIGDASRRASGADYLVANTLDMVDGDRAGAYLLSDSAHEWVAREALPARLVEIVRYHLRV